jgi:hypothetical protein
MEWPQYAMQGELSLVRELGAGRNPGPFFIACVSVLARYDRSRGQSPIPLAAAEHFSESRPAR